MTRLASMIIAFEQKNDLTAGVVADEIGISESTYCRIKKGKMPDARNMALIITWMLN